MRGVGCQVEWCGLGFGVYALLDHVIGVNLHHVVDALEGEGVLCLLKKLTEVSFFIIS